jgi:hypothetical protein
MQNFVLLLGLSLVKAQGDVFAEDILPIKAGSEMSR